MTDQISIEEQAKELEKKLNDCISFDEDEDVYDHVLNLQALPAIKQALAERERMTLERAASLILVLEIEDPKTGPFTLQNRAIEQYRNAIRALIKPTEE